MLKNSPAIHTPHRIERIATFRPTRRAICYIAIHPAIPSTGICLAHMTLKL